LVEKKFPGSNGDAASIVVIAAIFIASSKKFLVAIWLLLPSVDTNDIQQ